MTKAGQSRWVTRKISQEFTDVARGDAEIQLKRDASGRG